MSRSLPNEFVKDHQITPAPASLTQVWWDGL